jgi:hypothetical protein
MTETGTPTMTTEQKAEQAKAFLSSKIMTLAFSEITEELINGIFNVKEEHERTKIAYMKMGVDKIVHKLREYINMAEIKEAPENDTLDN